MPVSWWRAKDSVYMTFGILFLILFGIGIASGISYLYGFPYPDPTFLPKIAAFCIPTGLAPGILLIFLARRAKKREKELVEFTAWIKTYRRIGLDELARKLGKPQYEAEKTLIEVVDRGLLKGFIDRATDEFVLQEAIGQEQFIETCPRCQANISKRYFLGETVTCPYCNAVIAQRRPASPP